MMSLGKILIDVKRKQVTFVWTERSWGTILVYDNIEQHYSLNPCILSAWWSQFWFLVGNNCWQCWHISDALTKLKPLSAAVVVTFWVKYPMMNICFASVAKLSFLANTSELSCWFYFCCELSSSHTFRHSSSIFTPCCIFNSVEMCLRESSVLADIGNTAFSPYSLDVKLSPKWIILECACTINILGLIYLVVEWQAQGTELYFSCV